MAAKPEMLWVVIPEVPPGARFTFHPISGDQNPKRYKPGELLDSGEARTEWLKFFEEILVGLYWKHGGPVPFVFRTTDGTVRSLDAGCLKWLWNRKPPEIKFHCNSSGLVDAVTPLPAMISRYEEDREALVARVSWVRPPAS